MAAPLLGGAAIAQLAPFTHYTTETEPRALPSAEVHAVYQDRLGFIWAVVYSSGLVRYDGVRMELYTPDDGLPGIAVWDALEDEAGHLWVSSNAGLAVTDRPLDTYGPGERLQFVTERDGVQLLEVEVRRNVMEVAPDGSLWVGTNAHGIVRYRFERGRLAADTISTVSDGTATLSGDERAVTSIVARADGSMWVSLSPSQLFRLDQDGSRTRITGEGAPRADVFALYEDPDGTLWGGDGGRLWRLDDQGGRHRFETVSTTLRSSIHGIRSVGDERLAAASQGSGLLVIHRRGLEEEEHLTRLNGLISDVVHGLVSDLEGNIWIAQSGGLSLLRRSYRAFQSYTARSQLGERPVLPAPAVSAVQSAPSGSPCSLWAATNEAGIACVHADGSGTSSYVSASDGLASDWVNALLLDADGRLWVGTSRGLNAVAPAHVPLPHGQSVRNVRVSGQPYRVASYLGSTILSAASLQLPRDDEAGERVATTWFASARSATVLIDDRWYNFGEAAGLPGAVVHAIAADAQGHVWIGTRDRGLYRSREPVSISRLQQLAEGAPGSAAPPPGLQVAEAVFERVWSSTEGAPTDQIESLLWHEGQLWTATPVGLFALEYDANRGAVSVNAHLDQAAGLGAPQSFSLAASPVTGTLWVGTNGGLSEVDPASASVLRTLTRRNGLVDNEVWYYGSVRIDREGRVYFGTAQGLSIYDPRYDRPAADIQRVLLRRADIERNPGGRSGASFAYAAIAFSSQEGILYRTRLRGYESDWSEPTAETSIRYTNLSAIFSPRQYTFEVVASNQPGRWIGDPVTYSFRVSPPFLLQWWMFVFYAMVAGAGVALIHRVQSRRLIARLQAQSQLREAEYRAQRAAAQQEAAEARAHALQAENERKEAELTKARELEAAYNELKAAQTQLIQAEKMASLGQLTAGIAHEIKNPLNFVNNFSRASIDLLAELREELEALGPESRPESIELIVEDLATMAEKVAQHGDRADRIVKSMLQHSRGGSGTFQEENLNSFVEEYVNLAYHGMRAQNSDFNVEVVREYDDRAGAVQVISQDFSRVIINLLNNAFYAVQERRKSAGPEFEPRVTIRTEWAESAARIQIEDNGTGIPEKVRQRIFEPFFSTKPTGEGTGLGLSLSYEIITQMHRGHLEVTTEEGCGTTFTIELPQARPARSGTVLERAASE